MKVQKTYTIQPEIAEKFSEQTPARKTSEELEKLMEKYIDQEIETEEPTYNVLENSYLTDKQQKLLEFIYQNNLFGKKTSAIKQKISSEEGIYGRGWQFKEGINSVVKKSNLELEKSRVIAPDFECPSCGGTTNLSEISDLDGECLCGTKLVRKEEIEV